MNFKFFLTLAFCIFTLSFVFITHSSGKIVERILVIINDDVITQSEFDDRVAKTREQLRLLYKYNDTILNEEIEKAKPQILETMIDEILFVQDAIKRNIQISDAQVQKEIEDIKKQFKTEKEFEDAMKAEGYTMESLRKEKKRSLLLQELIKQKFSSDLVIKDDEVKKFYRDNRDKFPTKNDTVKLKQILLKYNLTKEDKEKARSKAEDVLKQCKEGADFGEMALKYSDDPLSRANKGNIGYFIPGTGDFPEYEDIVTNLKLGEISDLIEMPDGFDIIKVTDVKRDGRIGLQRIYIAIQPDPSAEKATLEKADLVLNELKKGADFVQMVKKYSDDPITKEKDGDWMEVHIDNLSNEMQNAFNSLEVGEISKPIKSHQGIHIFKIVDRKELTEDEMEQIRRYLTDQRLQEKLEEYSKKLRETAYIAYPKSNASVN
ncbi:TPA: hypothetical protein ENX78_10255 [Candidatus Poribacteria bacterium]|nr:hypothetical protein [Candidatus Poribacteria bacterium]